MRELAHALSDNLASHSPSKVEFRVPQLNVGLHFEPSQADEETKDHTGFVVLTTGPLGCFNYILRDNPAVGVSQGGLIDLTGDDLLNLVFQPQGDLGNLLGGLRRLSFIVSVGRKHCDAVSCVTRPVLTMTYVGDVRLLRGDAFRD